MLYITAEIGINHNGDINIAKRLIKMAKLCGCDAVKFQKRSIDIVYTKRELASYRESPWGDTVEAQKRHREFGRSEYDAIDRYCKKLKIDWYASAWDEKSLQFLKKYNTKHNKVASAILTNTPLVKAIAKEKKHTFISTGMSTFKDIDKAIEIFKSHKCPFTLMHCVSTYPCEDKNCNILAIKTLQKRYRCPIGYSGHERGILPSVLAVAFGVVAIERHITLDRTMYGSDQAASLEKRGLELLVRDARSIHSMLGDGRKRITPEEIPKMKSLKYHEE